RNGMRGREHDRVEAHAAQLPKRMQACAEGGDPAFAAGQVLQLRVSDDLVEVGIALEDRRVVAVDECADPAVRVLLAQCSEERCRANQVADVIAANDEDAHAVQRAAWVRDCIPQARRTPTTPQYRSAFWRTQSTSVMLRTSMPATMASSANPHAAAALLSSKASRQPSLRVAARSSTRSARPGSPTCTTTSRNRLCVCQRSGLANASRRSSRSSPRPKP